ncbi:MAG TPA: cobalamin-dependent protein [Candidatus Limnocylindria bacterium]|nr:cobalamin-dependent protein [Candidatus Limnocylindria bacterium]
MAPHPKGTRARVLLTSVFKPFAQDDEFGSREQNPIELYHNQVTREQGPFSLRMFHRSWGLMFLQQNITAPCTLLDFPSREEFVAELSAHAYDIVGISSIIVNVGKVKEMCRLVRQHSPHSTIVVGGHVAAIPGIERMIDADHVVKGEGIAWLREFLGEKVDRPIVHPIIPSSFDLRVMGMPNLQRKPTSATIVSSVGCPMGCNFCTTSAFFGGKGNIINFYETGAELFEVMCNAERALNVSSFFMMDENFLLQRTRALELLELMKAAGKSWSLYVFSSANAVKKYKMRELVELGIEWIWLGLESPQSSYAKLNGTDTQALARELQSHGIALLGSTIIGLEHHTPGNIHAEIEHAVAHDAVFHQFMLYTPVPGTPLYKEVEAQQRLRTDVELADIHGQHEFNFLHGAIGAADSKKFLDYAFRRDFERNGPSLYRFVRTMFERWKKYGASADPRVRERALRGGRQIKAGYGAVLWAMEKYFRKSNAEVSSRIREVRRDMEREMGGLTTIVTRSLGPLLLWTSRRDARRHPKGRRLEPRTFIERARWPGQAVNKPA